MIYIIVIYYSEKHNLRSMEPGTYIYSVRIYLCKR